MALPFVTLVIQRQHGDCGLAALAMLLGLSYEDVLAAAVTRRRPKPHVGGMYTREVTFLARRLGTPLAFTRTWDLETDCGLLTVEKTKITAADTFTQHLVLLKFGLVFDTDGTVWEPETYFAQHDFRPVSLLVEKGTEEREA